jgi:uncharacterized protein (DUF2235 family)
MERAGDSWSGQQPQAGQIPQRSGQQPDHRNIVVFSDGTGNSSAQLFRTNVWRTYQALDRADPPNPPNPRQFAFYDDGVGTSSFKPAALLGGAIGLGLGRNVRDLYAFVCRTYRPADPGQNREADKIYAFGFSRGAFTIRVLVGLIATQGLVPYDGDEAKLQRRVAAAWSASSATSSFANVMTRRTMSAARVGSRKIASASRS